MWAFGLGDEDKKEEKSAEAKTWGKIKLGEVRNNKKGNPAQSEMSYK